MVHRVDKYYAPQIVIFIVCTIAILASPLISNARADYLVLGKIEGWACKSRLIFESCGLVPVDAVEGPGGQPYTIQPRYKTVSEYKKKLNRCWINIKPRKPGLLGGLIGRATAPKFLMKMKDGTYQQVDVENITFKCQRVD